MKRLFLITVLILSVFRVNAQDSLYVYNKDYKEYNGFYLSLAGGVNFANITSKIVNKYDYAFKGSGGVFDLKIGGAIKEGLILHATITSKLMSGPEVYSNGLRVRSYSNLTIGEAMMGVGLTYYSQENVLLSGSVGIGNYTLIDDDDNKMVSTDRGFSMQLKIGKEWRVSEKWGLGVALTYSKSKLTNTPDGSIEELMDSNNFGILFNTSFN